MEFFITKLSSTMRALRSEILIILTAEANVIKTAISIHSMTIITQAGI